MDPSCCQCCTCWSPTSSVCLLWLDLRQDVCTALAGKPVTLALTWVHANAVTGQPRRC